MTTSSTGRPAIVMGRLAALFPRLTRGLLGRLMLLNWVMLVLFYLVLVAPVLWSLRPAKMVTPY